jgi:hypothetical protein
MVQKSFTTDVPVIDFLTWFFERQLLKSKDTDELFIDAETPKNYITRGRAKELAQKIGYSLREIEGIGANGAGKDVVSMYSSNQVTRLISLLISDHVSHYNAWDHLCWWSI